jgi:hypothetical protein
LEKDIVPPKDGEDAELETFDSATRITRIGTIAAKLAFGDNNERVHEFEVCRTHEDMLIGTDLFKDLGLYVGGVPYRWPNDSRGVQAAQEALAAEDALRQRPKSWALQDQASPDDRAIVMKRIEPLLCENDMLDPRVPACQDIPE